MGDLLVPEAAGRRFPHEIESVVFHPGLFQAGWQDKGADGIAFEKTGLVFAVHAQGAGNVGAVGKGEEHVLIVHGDALALLADDHAAGDLCAYFAIG